ncbi:MAG: acyltransferase [Silicimonas sp.]|nr:acyltransferase [Silicimonas sp.]NNL36273.1 acyltransferase [Silicimonas sp.]
MDSAEPSEAYRRYREKTVFGSLDGLRCLCIALVLWHHRPFLFSDATELPRILSRGFTGVDFFFVLSGFLITTLLLREEDRNGRFSLTGFYRRRFFRIIPLYFLVVTVCAVWWIGVRGQGEWWGYLPYYYGFLANFLDGDIPLLAPTWSLSVEEQYYLIWPALLLLIPMLKWRVPLVTGLIVAIYATAEGFLPWLAVAETARARIVLPDPAYGAILIGSLVALVLHRPKGFGVVWRVLGHRASPLVLMLALMAAWQFLPVDLLGWPGLVMHLLMAGVLTGLVLREDHVLADALRWRPVARVGEISYGLYLWHLFGLHIGFEAAKYLGFQGLVAGWVALPIYLAAAVVIAEISFRWFESYFLRLKSKSPQHGGRGLRPSD